MPQPVEEQIAVIFVAGKGLIDSLPTSKVKTFEKEFIERMKMRHPDAMSSIVSSGAVSDEVAEAFTKEAKELVDLYVSQG